MASKAMMGALMEGKRRLHDQALRLSGNLVGYNNATLYHYSTKMTDMKDEIKTLLDTTENLSIYVDFPSSTSSLNSNVVFIEDLLPIVALFPWLTPCGGVLKVDVFDEFEIDLVDEFGNTRRERFSIVDRVSTYETYHLYREFIVAPKRADVQNMGSTQTDGSYDDPNLKKGSVQTSDSSIINEVISAYN